MSDIFKFLSISTILIILKLFEYTTVDWIFISIFILYAFLNLPKYNYKSIVINIDTLFEERRYLRSQIDDLYNKIENCKKKD